MKKALLLFILIVLGGAIFGSSHSSQMQRYDEKWQFGTPYLVDLVRVVDGDTLVIEFDNNEHKVRLIGLDSPESVKPNAPVECFGPESSQYMNQLLQGVTSVSLLLDQSQGATDKHGRLLGYVFLNDGRNIAAEMIRAGYAYEYTYDKKYQHQQVFREAQTQAKNNDAGLWQPGVCQ